MSINSKLTHHDRTGYSKFYYYKLTFLLGLALSICIFLPFVIKDSGIFVYYGDYNVQQIPFHRHGVEMFRNFNFGWDWCTDLGSNFMGDYSFYMTTSPFFLIMCLFPASWSPYLMAPIYTLKFAVAALCAYAYLKRFVKKPLVAVAGALMYAFSGFQIYNVFFNHFHDSVAFFPLLLLGMEELIQNNRRGWFAFAVFISGSVNYFFFVGEVVFCVMYFFFRCSSLSFKLTMKKFLLLCFEAIVGVLMSLVFLLPSILSILSNNRLDREFKSLKSAFVYTWGGKLYTKRYGHIFQSLFYPPDIPSRPEFFGGKDLNDATQTHTTRWASNAAWVPLFGMTGALTYIWNRRRSWLSRFIVFLTVCALVPVLNSLFFAGNSSYYARWMFMFVMMIVLATIISLDKLNIKWNAGIILTAICSFAILVPSFISWKEVNSVWSTTRSSYPLRILISAIICFGCIALSYVLVKYIRGRKVFEKAVLGCLCFVIVFYGFIHILTGKQHCSDSSVDFYLNYCVNSTVTMKESNSEPDSSNVEGAPISNVNEQFYRMDLYNKDGDTRSYIDNYGIFWNLPSIQCFNSTVPAAILDFYPKVNVTRNVASRPANTLYGLRGFLSVKYCFVEKRNISKFAMNGFTEEPVSKQNKAPDGTYRFNIYENEYYLPMGFTYEAFMTESEFEKIGKSDRHIYLCSYLVVPDEMADYYSKILPEAKRTDVEKPSFDVYAESVEARKNGNVCEDFEWGSYGFKANIDTDKKQLVFFSVPYDVGELAGIPIGGWSAKVNGQSVDIKKVFYGFMAVEVPAGKDISIEFEYITPGRVVGIMASIIGFALLLAYLLIFRMLKKPNGDYNFLTEAYYDDLGYSEYNNDKSLIDTLRQTVEQLFSGLRKKKNASPSDDENAKNKK